ncbi:pyruvate kinase-like [Polistes fuscatus]|uniref:pyruvate kinase-like n=1 Tax=Polistes fuscatus TaxID=30207 RepID=UPI001CA885E1|nr:pyruvate kinase-like [Polistes fuscatus]
MPFDDEMLHENQLNAAYEKNRLDHYMHLNVDSIPRSVKLTGLMVTMGVTNSYPSAIAEISKAGANIVRLNFSHQTDKWHVITIRSIREAGNILHNCERRICPIAVAVNLSGSEIRTGIFRGDPLSMDHAVLVEGNTVRLLTDDRIQRAGTSSCFWVSCQELKRVCQIGDRISIDHGAVLLKVTCIGSTGVTCKVLKGGIIGNEKTIQLLDSIISFPMVSEKDKEDIKLASNLKCDFIIINHSRSGKMICLIKNEIKKTDSNWMRVIAKISSRQGLQNFDEILKEADGIIFERVGVALDIGKEKLFLAQKSVTAKCNKVGKPVVIIFHPQLEERPKINKELIANAVLDGADTICLATGNLNLKDTLKLIKDAHVVCREAESARWQREIFDTFSNMTMIPLDVAHSIAVGAIQTSLKCNAAAIIITTTTGRSAVLLSIYRPRCPIIAVTRFGFVARFLQIYFAVHSIHYKVPPLTNWLKDINVRVKAGMNYLKEKNYINVGDAIVVVGPSQQNGAGFTNSIRLVYVSPDFNKPMLINPTETE